MFFKAKGFLLWLFGWEEPAMSPDQIIDAKAQEMTVNLNRCKVHVARLIKEQRDLQEKIHRNTNQLTHHLREARNSMVRNEEGRAREHLRLKKKHEQIGERLNQALGKFKNEAEKLVDTVRRLEFNLEDLKRNKMLLLTQRQCYEAQLLLEGENEVDGQVGVRDLLAGLEEEVLEKQTRVFLEHDLDSDALSIAADRELLAETESAEVEEELAQLKQRITQVSSGDDDSSGGGGGIDG